MAWNSIKFSTQEKKENKRNERRIDMKKVCWNVILAHENMSIFSLSHVVEIV